MFSFRQQYRQMDFLRLFRLCYSLGIAKRKRKMPIEYTDEAQATAAGRRLLKSLLEKHLFDGWPKLRTRYEDIIISVPRDDRMVFNDASRLIYDSNLVSACGDLGEKALQKYQEITRTDVPFVRAYFPYEIKVHTTNRNADTLGGYKPAEKLYECALSCIEFKALLDDCMPTLREFHEFYQTKWLEIEAEREREIEENRRRSQEELRRQREELQRRAEERVAAENERRAALAAQVSAEVERTRQSAQDRFNQALSRFRENGSTRGEGEA